MISRVDDMAVECRTTSPNDFLGTGPFKTAIPSDDQQSGLDQSVLSHIRPSDRPLFIRQESMSCQQIFIVCPVRNIVDSEREPEGRSRPSSPSPGEATKGFRARDESVSGSGSEMELADSPEASGKT